MLEYKGLHADYEHITITEQAVNRQIDRLLEQNKRMIPITDRPAQLDDEVVVSYTGTVDGVPFEGGSAEDQPLVLGGGAYIAGFEEQLVGHRAGERMQVRVTFPVGYPVTELAGRKAVFDTTIRQIRVYAPYAPDDTFAKEVGGEERFDVWKAKLAERMQRYADRASDEDMKNRFMDALVERWQGEVEPEQLERALDIEMRNLQNELSKQRLTLEQYCQFMGKTEAQLRQEFEPNARKNVIRQQIVAEIARAEQIEATEEDVAAQLSRLCEENGMSLEDITPYYDEAMANRLARSVIEEKVLRRIADYAVIRRIEKEG